MWSNIKIQRALIQLSLILCVLAGSNCILIPLSGKAPRCMIIYSVGESETIKMDVNFPPLENQQPGQFYQISWTNTENNETIMERKENGRFKRELDLVQNVIYDLCIKVDSYRDYGTVMVEYNSHNIFAVNQAEVKVPDNLLKSEHITEAFLSASNIEKNIDTYEKIQQKRTSTHAETFRKTNKISERLVQISVAELVIIIAASVYQFWAISQYLRAKSYA